MMVKFVWACARMCRWCVGGGYQQCSCARACAPSSSCKNNEEGPSASEFLAAWLILSEECLTQNGGSFCAVLQP